MLWGELARSLEGRGHVMASLYTIFRSLNCILKTLGEIFKQEYRL